MVGNWKNFLAEEKIEPRNDIRKHERTGRPAGTEGFVDWLELEFGRSLKPGLKMTATRRRAPVL